MHRPYAEPFQHLISSFSIILKLVSFNNTSYRPELEIPECFSYLSIILDYSEVTLLLNKTVHSAHKR